MGSVSCFFHGLRFLLHFVHDLPPAWCGGHPVALHALLTLATMTSVWAARQQWSTARTPRQSKRIEAFWRSAGWGLFLSQSQPTYLGGVISIWIIRCIENRELYSRTRSFAFDEDHAHFLCFTAAKIHGPCQSIQRIEIQTASCKLHTNMPESLDFAYMDLDMSQKSTKPKSHRQSWFS